MIVWYNCKISDKRLTPVGPRFNLKNNNRFDIAKYTFASLKPLDPLISAYYFNLELDDPYKGREQEMEEFILDLFPSAKIKWYRCNNVTQWKELQPEFNSIDDDILFVAGNDDHVFWDSNLDVYKKGLELISKDPDPRAALVYCHYPETLRQAYSLNGKLTDCGNFVIYNFDCAVSVAITKKELYNRFLEKETNTSREVYRLDGWQIEWYSKIYAPTKEIGRHFDGYNHVNMDPNICPPLEVPPGFFEKEMIIRYGFDDYDPKCVNINPKSKNLHTVDQTGADYKFTLDDIPAFWKPYIKDVIISPNVDHNELARFRDQYFLELSSPTFWGGKLNIPQQWIKQHLLTP